MNSEPNSDHLRKEERYWDDYISLTRVTAGAAIVGAGFAFGAFYQTWNQAYYAANAQRPWAELSAVLIDSPLTFPESGVANITLQYDVKNLGHTPVRGVRVDTQPYFLKYFADTSDLDARKQLRQKVCTAQKRESREIFSEGYGIAPDAVFPQWSVFKNDSHGDASIKVGDRPEMSLVFIGCITYGEGDSFISNKIHQTGIEVVLSANDRSADEKQKPSHIAPNLPIKIVGTTPIAAEDMRASPIHEFELN